MRFITLTDDEVKALDFQLSKIHDPALSSVKEKLKKQPSLATVAWTEGITVETMDQEWKISAEFQRGLFAQSDFTEGKIYPRYLNSSLAEAIDVLLDSMKKQNIVPSYEMPKLNDVLKFALYSKNNSSKENKIIKEEAKKRGWEYHEI